MSKDLGCAYFGWVRGKKRVVTKETSWGFVIMRGGCADKRAYWGEVSALMGVFAFGAVAYAQWLWPGTNTSAELFPFRMGITVAFFVLSTWLYFIARTGLTTEVQVDAKSGHVGFVRRNKEGYGVLEDRCKFEEIESLFITRTQTPFSTDRLYARIQGRRSDVLIATAPKKELEPLLDRLHQTCRPAVLSVSARAKISKTQSLQHAI